MTRDEQDGYMLGDDGKDEKYLVFHPYGKHGGKKIKIKANKSPVRMLDSLLKRAIKRKVSMKNKLLVSTLCRWFNDWAIANISGVTNWRAVAWELGLTTNTWFGMVTGRMGPTGYPYRLNEFRAGQLASVFGVDPIKLMTLATIQKTCEIQLQEKGGVTVLEFLATELKPETSWSLGANRILARREELWRMKPARNY